MNRRIYLMILYIVTIAAVIIGGSIHLGWGIFNFSGCGKAAVLSGNYQEKTWNNLSFEALDIDCSVSNVTITYGDANKVYYYGPEELIPTVEVSGKELQISQPKRKFNTKGITGNKGPSLEITVKDGLKLTNIETQQNVGNLYMKGINCTKLKANTDVGNIDFSNVSVSGSSTVKSSVGNVGLSGCTFADLEVSADVGNVSLSSSSFENLDGETGTGDFDIKGFDGENYSISLSTGVGNVKYMGENYKKEFNLKNRNAKYSLSLSSGVGDVDVR